MKQPRNENGVCSPGSKTTHQSSINNNRKETPIMLDAHYNSNLILKSSTNEPLRMSSREIAELVNSRHDDVKRSIERLAERGTIQLPPLADVKNHRGQTVSEYSICKRDTYIIVAQLSPEFTARLVDRWQELEEKQEGLSIQEILSSPVHLLEIAQGYAQQVIELTDENNSMKSDVNALTRIKGSDDMIGVRLTSKILDMPQNKFTEWLQRNGWAYRQNGSKKLLCYADKHKAGYCRNVIDLFPKPDGSEGVRETLKFYPIGIIKIAKKLGIQLTENDIRAFSAVYEAAE